MSQMKKQELNTKTYKLLLWKAYFDKGWGLSNYFKYFIAFAGIFNFIDGVTAVYIGFAYIIFCFIFGWLWYRRGFIDTENEIQNHFNPFQREIRHYIKKRKV